MLALVAALAALAVVGRLAFAAFPNVKPTTDIVLLAGYALGGAPGFAVGAITPVVSNVFMGQGPWTPWQMAAWGGVGIGGAVLARVTGGRELGRLAARARLRVSRASAFGVVMDTYQWTLAAEQNAATWIAVSGSSLPYNLAHVDRQRRLLPADRPGAAARAVALPAPLRGALGAPPPRRPARSSCSCSPCRPGPPRRRRASARRRGSPRLRTRTAASGARPARHRASSSPAGRRSGSRRAGATRATSSGAATARSTSSAARRRTSARWGRSSARSSCSRRPACRRASSRDATSSPGSSATGARTARSPASSPTRRSGSSRCAPRDASATGESARWLAEQQNGDGGFGLAPGAQSDVDNTGAAIQALAAGRADRGDRRGRRLPARRAELRRRLRPVRRPQLERAVDRLRRPGPGRGRPQPRPVPQERPLAARLPALAAAAERQRRLLARELADAGVGDGAGRDGAEAKAVPARSGAARAGAVRGRGVRSCAAPLRSLRGGERRGRDEEEGRGGRRAGRPVRARATRRRHRAARPTRRWSEASDEPAAGATRDAGPFVARRRADPRRSGGSRSTAAAASGPRTSPRRERPPRRS